MNPPVPAETGAIYCRIPHLRSEDQTSVDRQEFLCRTFAAEHDVPIAPRLVYLDTRALAWQRDRSRSGWEAMLSAARSGDFGHLICYAPEELLHWQPFDLMDLLQTADTHDIALYGCITSRDLSDPEQRQLLLDEAERACQAASDASATAKAAHEIAAAEGRPHGGGLRAYGYTAITYELVDAETAVVREIYTRFLAGESIRSIAVDLYNRGLPTAGGNRWTVGGVTRILDAPRYAGLRVFRSAILRAEDGSYVAGSWEPCVSTAEWEQVHALRESRNQARAADRRPPRLYPLTGLLLCTKCDHHMVGTMIGTYPFYACTSKSGLAADRCRRHIAAERLETFMEEAAITALEQWGSQGAAVSPVATPVDTRFSDLDTDLRRLKELARLRRSEQIPTAEYAVLRATALRRVRAAQQTVKARPADALDGVVTGPRARFHWDNLPLHRRATVMRTLFSSIRIGPSSTSRSVFDYSRIDLVAT